MRAHISSRFLILVALLGVACRPAPPRSGHAASVPVVLAPSPVPATPPTPPAVPEVLPEPPALALDHACWEDAEDHIQTARAARDQGDRETAVMEYREALVHEPGSLAAVSGLASVAREAGKTSLAAAAYELWMELDGSDAEPALALSRLRFDEGENEAAMRLAAQAAIRDPHSGDARFLEGQVLLQVDELPAALTALQDAVLLDPEHGHAFDLLGRTYMRLGRSEEAVRALETAVRLLPEAPEVALDLGRALREAPLSSAVPGL